MPTRTFRIDVSLLGGGTLVGSWDRDFPTSVIGCSISQAAEALLFSDTNRIFQQSGAGTYSAKFFMGNITLSGGFPEDGVYASINNLPPGVTPVTAIPQATTSHPGSDAGYTFTITALGAGVGGSTPTSNITISYIYNTIPSMLQLTTEEIGVTVTHPGTYGAIKGLFITGTYAIVQQQSSLVTIQNSTVPIGTGSKIQISATAGFGGLGSVTQIQLSYLDSSGVEQFVYINSGSYDIIVQSDTELWFYLPLNHWYYAIITVTLIGDGTQFSGSIIAGTLQVLFENASGIYELVKSQTNDVLYFRSGYTTNIELLMLPDIKEDEIYYSNEDLFNNLSYPTKILVQNFIDEEDYEQGDYSMISVLSFAIVPLSVEIPSPFIKTAFLP